MKEDGILSLGKEWEREKGGGRRGSCKMKRLCGGREIYNVVLEQSRIRLIYILVNKVMIDGLIGWVIKMTIMRFKYMSKQKACSICRDLIVKRWVWLIIERKLYTNKELIDISFIAAEYIRIRN